MSPIRRLNFTLVLAAFSFACGGSDGPSEPQATAPVIATPPQNAAVATPNTATFTVSATGTAPLSYQWKRNGTDIQGATGTSYTTPATTVGDHGTQYSVTVSNSAGSATASATLTVTAGRARLFTTSWGDGILRITEDVLAATSPATPKTVTGPATTMSGGAGNLDDLVVDRTRNLVYQADLGTIRVWANASTVSGNVAPSRTITIPGATGYHSVFLDEAADRLYLIVTLPAGSRLIAYNQASTRSGNLAPDATVNLGRAYSWTSFDRVNNRLYATLPATDTVFVYDGVSTLTGSVNPTRTIKFTGLGLRDIFIDVPRNRLYLASRDASPGGYNIFAFTNASALTGVIADPDAASAARWQEGSAMGVMVDAEDRVYWWGDSALMVEIYFNASALTGAVTKAPDKAVSGVASRAYGWDVWTY
ncbi:MAG: hypothetical protein HUU26_06560 [Gemmatimonadaceae bacterium]|nr:hypothetical protein [Gemmatimonadaceae bacterium]